MTWTTLIHVHVLSTIWYNAGEGIGLDLVGDWADLTKLSNQVSVFYICSSSCEFEGMECDQDLKEHYCTLAE